MLLLLGACNSSETPAGDKGAPAKSGQDKTEELLANAPPEGEVVDVKVLDGTLTDLEAYKGKVLLIVNTASECGYTPQYEDLQTVYNKYRARGFEVLAFPSNDYGAQEPGNAAEIRKFVDEKYSVEFPVFDKVVVKGPDKAPLFKMLTEQAEEGMQGEVKWNFTKFLVDPSGKVVGRFEPSVKPTDAEITDAIERILPKGA
ncbi:MAG: glutathione peroxidase [Nannocystaceae bacterium]|nr:glutathione peroxidase [Nannocystaceae bacterium]